MISSNTTMEAVPAELRMLLEQALAESRRHLSNRGAIEPLVLVRMPDNTVERATIPHPLSEVMNSGDAKSHLFAGIRKWVNERGVTAVAFVTDSWVGMPTEKQKRMAEEDREALHRYFDEEKHTLDEAIEAGLCYRTEALVISVQTADDVVVVNQPYTRQGKRRIEFGERTITRFAQEGFMGRQKMFGVKSDADIR